MHVRPTTSPTRSGSISADHGVAADAAADERAGRDPGAGVVRAPEQKYGARSTESGISDRPPGRGQRRQPFVEAGGEAATAAGR